MHLNFILCCSFVNRGIHLSRRLWNSPVLVPSVCASCRALSDSSTRCGALSNHRYCKILQCYPFFQLSQIFGSSSMPGVPQDSGTPPLSFQTPIRRVGFQSKGKYVIVECHLDYGSLIFQILSWLPSSLSSTCVHVCLESRHAPLNRRHGLSLSCSCSILHRNLRLRLLLHKFDRRIPS